MSDDVNDMKEFVFVNRAMIAAGILVGIGGEHDQVPTQAQLNRATELIMRAGRKHRQDMERVVAAIERYPSVTDAEVAGQ